MRRFSLLSQEMYQEHKSELCDTEPLLSTIRACVAAQRQASARRREDFRAEPQAGSYVSQQTLEDTLATGTVVSGLATNRHITNAIPFEIRHIADAVRDHRLARLLREFDAMLSDWSRESFAPEDRPVFFSVAQYWYPPGSYMGWHTNSSFPGWRLYITYCAEPHKSFFRYRDPLSGEIVTSMDTGLDFRLFRVSAERPLWHAVYSETDRFSLGYMVRPWSPRVAAIRSLRPWVDRLRALRCGWGTISRCRTC